MEDKETFRESIELIIKDYIKENMTVSIRQKVPQYWPELETEVDIIVDGEIICSAGCSVALSSLVDR